MIPFEIVCCRELDPRGLHGPCVAITIPVDRTAIVVRAHRVVCDMHNRMIVVVAGVRVGGAARP